MKRSISVSGEFRNKYELENLVIRGNFGAIIHIKDIAEVKDGFKEKESYARLEGKPVITLNIVKRSGENLIEASDNCREIVDELKSSGQYPEKLNVVFTGDQSTKTRTTVHDLINTIIIGFILVVLILMFFMGATNAIFVGLSVPLSCFVAFLVMPTIGFSLNFIVLFSFLLALGIVVDDAIVVVENTHRIYHEENISIVSSQKSSWRGIPTCIFGNLNYDSAIFPIGILARCCGEIHVFLTDNLDHNIASFLGSGLHH